VLEPGELAGLNAAVRRVFALMRNGAWYNADEICNAAGVGDVSASEGLRRMRELRQYFIIDKRRLEKTHMFGKTYSRMFEYRLRKKEINTIQLELIKCPY